MLKLYNTLTKNTIQVEPVQKGKIKMYTCGPTVYRDAHIGNLRSYLMADWIRRVLEIQGLHTTHVKNITDVGHMRQELLEQGDDKVIAAALAEGKSPAEIAHFYTERFLRDEKELNIISADVFPKATDHVKEMLNIVEELVNKKLAYEIQGNVYFNVSAFPDYGKLSGNDLSGDLLDAVRIETDPLKKDPRDFTLWKKAEPGRELKWPSIWGEGFPGWHIECSAMSIKYLGSHFDIHTGGVDNIFPHHEGEIAQSEGYIGRDVVNLWVHGQHLLADGVKMSKSSGNSFILSDLHDQSIDPLAFRYLCLTAKYGTRLNFTFNSVKAAQRGLTKMKNLIWNWVVVDCSDPNEESVINSWYDRFLEAINDNLNLPSALSLTWSLLKSDTNPKTKLNILYKFDDVLGLGLSNVEELYRVPDHVSKIVDKRKLLRAARHFVEGDAIRDDLYAKGYVVEDTSEDTRVRPKTAFERREEQWFSFSSSSEVPSLINTPESVRFTVGVIACNYLDDVKRCVSSALKNLHDISAEIIIVDNNSHDGTGEWTEHMAQSDKRVKVIHTDHILGEAAAKNIILRQANGTVVTLLDTSVEIIGDIFTPIEKLLEDDTIGLTGPLGLRTNNLHHFHDGEGESGEMDAMQAYCFSFKRERIKEVGFMREVFRFYRNLDLDYSFHFKDKGYRIIADHNLPVRLHEHRAWSELAEGERDELSRKNYGRFLKKWENRNDLLVNSEPDE